MIIVEFKTAFMKFLKTLEYMREKRLHCDPNSDEWKKLCNRFNTQIADPMDSLWSKLSPEQRKSF